jgi:hypothetical protein
LFGDVSSWSGSYDTWSRFAASSSKTRGRVMLRVQPEQHLLFSIVVWWQTPSTIHTECAIQSTADITASTSIHKVATVMVEQPL